MIFDDLVDKVVRRTVAVQDMAERGFPVPSKPADTLRRSMLESYREAGRLQKNDLLDFAIEAVRQAEGKIRKTKLSCLSAGEIKKFKESAIRDLIKRIEERKVKQLLSLLDQADERRKKAEKLAADPNYIATMKKLTRLEEAKLCFSQFDETEALVELNRMAKTGYHEEDHLVLSAISRKTRQRAESLKESLPAYISDETGIGLKRQIEELIGLKTGELSYQLIAVPGISQKINVNDLVTDLVPTLADVTV